MHRSSVFPTMRLLAVIVLYRMQPEMSISLQSLLRAASSTAQYAEGLVDLTVLVWDNTPGGQTISKVADGISYHADPANPGLATAYNSAISMAVQEGCEWLLTLDQDTEVPIDLLFRLAAHTENLPEDTAAVLPRVMGANRVLSPYRFVAKALPQWFGPEAQGIMSGVYALNSGSVLRVAAIQSVGGYDPLFPLDMSDTSLFHRLRSAGKRSLIVNDICLSHQLSLLNKSKDMSLDRYKASLRAEALFYERHMGLAGRLERMMRLGGRALRDQHDPALHLFNAATLEELKNRGLRMLQYPFRKN